jgi:HEAT repeat protein
MHAPQSVPVIEALQGREARYHDIFRLAALQGLAELEDPALVETFAAHVGPDFSQDVRLAAVDGWARAAPQDPALSRALQTIAGDPDYTLRGSAIETLGGLHRVQDLEFLLEYADSASDPNLQKLAREAAATIQSYTGAD